MKLYILEVIPDVPEFDGFGLSDFDEPSRIGREDFYEDITPGFEASETNRVWKMPSLEKTWHAPEVEGDVNGNDFPGLDFVFPVFSSKAIECLRDLLEPNGEILPLKTTEGSYYFFNITSVQDALDLNKAKCDFWCEPPTTAVDIDYFAFNLNKLKPLPIFRILEKGLFTIVSDVFVERVKESNLKGFMFRKIWPLKEGEYWRDSCHELSVPEIISK